MQQTQSTKAGERTHERGCMGNYDYRGCTCPTIGFLNSLRDCTFHFSEGQKELTIKAPDGRKIGLPFVEEMKGMTVSRTDRLARMAALELLSALKNLVEASKTPGRPQLHDARIDAISAIRLAEKGLIPATK